MGLIWLEASRLEVYWRLALSAYCPAASGKGAGLKGIASTASGCANVRSKWAFVSFWAAVLARADLCAIRL